MKIIIGENKIPLNIIYEQSSKFDGTLDIYYKCNKYVGNLKAVILISEKSFEDQVEIFDKLTSAKNLNESLFEEDVKISFKKRMNIMNSTIGL